MPRGGKLHFLDFNSPIGTIFKTGYLSVGSKVKLIKLLAFLFRNWKHLNYRDAASIAAIDHDTVKSYCDRAMNEEIYDYVASVVVRGPWLADPENTSIGQLLWTMKNFFKPYFYGLDDGMDALPIALAARLNVRLNCPVNAVTPVDDCVNVAYMLDGNPGSDRFEGCVIATPTEPALAIYPQMNDVQRNFYANTTYISAVDTHLVLRRRPSNPATYIMVSPRENTHLCGVIVDHLKAADRVPAGMGMLTVFCSDVWSKANMHSKDEDVLSDVLRFIEPYYGNLRDEIVDFEIARWPVVVPKMAQGRFKQIALYENRSI